MLSSNMQSLARAALVLSALMPLVVGCAGPRVDGAAVDLAIVGATVVNVDRDGPAATSVATTILIRGDRIVAVGPDAGTPVPPEARVIDGRGKWVIPGLIDGHVHFFQSGNLFTRPDVVDLNRRMPYAQEVARNQARLDATFKIWLASGVTGVVDLGGPMWNFEVRERARQTRAAPRVAVAGPLISLVDDRPLDLGDPPIIAARSATQARSLAEIQLARRPDYVKAWFIHGRRDDLQAQTTVVKAAGDAAHAAGVPFAVHATELAVAKAALRAGADYLVHSVEDQPVDDEFIELLQRSGALYCPTLFVTMGYDLALSDQWAPTADERRLADPQVLSTLQGLSTVPEDQLPRWVAQALREKALVTLSPVMAANLRRVWAAGVPVVMGTDAGNIGTVHGPALFREMALMQQAGLSPLQVLRSATLQGARALRLDDDAGLVAPGRLADLVLLDADPLASLSNLSRTWRVIKGGEVFDPRSLIDSLR